jgi:hypothetical protein
VLVIPICGTPYYALLNAGALHGVRWLALPLLIIGAVGFLSLMALFGVCYLRFMDANRGEGGTLSKPAMQFGGHTGSQPIRSWQWLVLGGGVLLTILVMVIRWTTR